MNRLQQLLHDKGALCHDLEAYTQKLADLRARLAPITAEINTLLQAQAAGVASPVDAVPA